MPVLRSRRPAGRFKGLGNPSRASAIEDVGAALADRAALSGLDPARPTASTTCSGDVDELAVLREVRVGARGKVETAGASLPALHLRDGYLDPPLPRIRVLGCIDPANPFPARHGRNLLPEVLDLLRSSCERCRKIRRHVGFRPFFARLNLERRGVTGAKSGGSLELGVKPHPVPKRTVGFQHRLEPMTIDRSFDRHLPPRRQFPARLLR